MTSCRREPKDEMGMTEAEVQKHLDKVVGKHLRELERRHPRPDGEG